MHRNLRLGIMGAIALLLLLASFSPLKAQSEAKNVEEDEISLDCATALYAEPGVRYMHRLRAADPEAEIRVGDLPEGLVWNARRSLVEGRILQEGVYYYDVYVINKGRASKTQISLTVSSHLQQLTPLMGWLSWNVVEGEISEEVVRKTADAMVSSGLRDAGYQYLVIDDLWHAAERDSLSGKPLPDARKFPNGMKVVADYVHAKGLKFGIYSDAAVKTCAGCYGSYGYEETDARQYAQWGVDLLKYDYCHAPEDWETARDRYRTMGDALKATGRDILFYMCEWGVRQPWKWGHETGASCWRCTFDTRDGWNGHTGGIGILQSIVGMKDLWAYSGPNRYNDADMMCVGIHGQGKSSNDYVDQAGMTQLEYQTQFALWCMWSSPLTLSFDLRQPISEEDLAIISHEELIAIDQDPMGQQAQPLNEEGGMLLLVKDLENGDIAVSVTNLNEEARDYVIDFSQIPALETRRRYHVQDVWKRQDLGRKKSLKLKVEAHQTLVYRLSL